MEEAESFLYDLPDVDQILFGILFETVEEGLPSDSPFNNKHFKKLPGTGGIRRFRVKMGKFKWWLLAFLDRSDPDLVKVVCTHAINKKSSRLGREAIAKAIRIRDMYFKKGDV